MSDTYIIYKISNVEFPSDTGGTKPRSKGQTVTEGEDVSFGIDPTLELLAEWTATGFKFSGTKYKAESDGKTSFKLSESPIGMGMVDSKKSGSLIKTYHDLISNLRFKSLVAVGDEISFPIGDKLKSKKFSLKFDYGEGEEIKVELIVDSTETKKSGLLRIQKFMKDESGDEVDLEKTAEMAKETLLVVEGQAPIRLMKLSYLDDSDIKKILDAYLADLPQKQDEQSRETRKSVFKFVQGLVLDYFHEDMRNRAWDLDQINRWIMKNYGFETDEIPD